MVCPISGQISAGVTELRTDFLSIYCLFCTVLFGHQFMYLMFFKSPNGVLWHVMLHVECIFTINSYDWEQMLHAPKVAYRESLFHLIGHPRAHFCFTELVLEILWGIITVFICKPSESLLTSQRMPLYQCHMPRARLHSALRFLVCFCFLGWAVEGLHNMRSFSHLPPLPSPLSSFNE